MFRIHRLFGSRASRAFSSLAISCVIAILSLLALSVGSLQDTRAEGMNSVIVNASMRSAGAAPVFSAALQQPSPASAVRLAGEQSWITRHSVAKHGQVSPVKEFFGLSKLAFPLLVSDLAPIAPSGKFVATMSGPTVGVR